VRVQALVLLVLMMPTAAAAVSVDRVVVPDRTLAEKPFPVSVTLVNDGEARSVHLFGALYRREEGAAPCGPATGTRFRAFTHIVQDTVELPARSTTQYPPEGETWLHRYRREHVQPEPRVEEFCVFVANATRGPVIEYEDYATTRLSVRGVNAKPVASFTWEPERPGATQDVRFQAEGSDADGDPVTFAWDFGYLGAGGRARGEGASPTTFFYPAGEYVVTLRASDGLEETQVSRTITVVEAARAEDRPGGLQIPVAAWLAIGALALAAFRRR